MSLLWRILTPLIAILGLLGFKAAYDWKKRREGAEAEKARQREAVLQHERATSDQVRKSDEALADPASDRARRVRRQFERDD